MQVQQDWLLLIPAKLAVQSVSICVAAHRFSIPKPTYKRFESVRKSSFIEFCCRQKVASLGTVSRLTVSRTDLGRSQSGRSYTGLLLGQWVCTVQLRDWFSSILRHCSMGWQPRRAVRPWWRALEHKSSGSLSRLFCRSIWLTRSTRLIALPCLRSFGTTFPSSCPLSTASMLSLVGYCLDGIAEIGSSYSRPQDRARGNLLRGTSLPYPTAEPS
jgi:hypothetical protein